MSGTAQASTLRDYLQVARRRWWIVLVAVLLTISSAAFFSVRQDKLYSASAEVLVRSGLDPSESRDRTLQTEADVAAASPQVAASVRNALGLRTTPDIEVTPRTNSNILTFTGTAASPDLAARVATEYGRQFSRFERQLALQHVREALREIEAELATLRLSRARDLALYSVLIDQREELRTQIRETQGAYLVLPAPLGTQVQPKLSRNSLLGLALGLVLGLGLAFLREALDTRVRSTDEVAEHLGIPLLARVPAPPRRLRRADRLVMISDPDGPSAEAFRILRANVEFARIETGARTVLVTSAVEGEGKSTSAANLAVALARAGNRVALVDLDLRRPYLHRFFNVEGPGLTDVANGSARLEEALVAIPLVWSRRKPWVADGQSGGMLQVLAAGPNPPSIDDVLANQFVAGVLKALRESADIVIIDSPPLVVGDAMALTAAVDALLIVTRMDTVRRPLLDELRRILDAIPAQTIGFAAAGVRPPVGYAGYAAHYQRTETRAEEPVP